MIRRYYGREKPVGGIRVSHLSHIEGEFEVSLSVARGVKRPVRVKPLQVEQQKTVNPQSNIRLIKADGSETRFNNYDEWLTYIETNLPKIDQIDRINTFEQNHQAIFGEYREAGFGVVVDKAIAIIDKNRQRLAGGSNGDL